MSIFYKELTDFLNKMVIRRWRGLLRRFKGRKSDIFVFFFCLSSKIERSVYPVSRLSVQMGNCDNNNSFRVDAINNSIRKP